MKNKKDVRHLTTGSIPPVIPMSDIFVVCFIILPYFYLSTLFCIKFLYKNFYKGLGGIIWYQYMFGAPF